RCSRPCRCRRHAWGRFSWQAALLVERFLPCRLPNVASRLQGPEPIVPPCAAPPPPCAAPPPPCAARFWHFGALLPPVRVPIHVPKGSSENAHRTCAATWPFYPGILHPTAQAMLGALRNTGIPFH